MAAVPFVATLIATSQGPGLSPDSITYLSSGINLAEGQGLHTLTGEALTLFPPGLPLIVAAGELAGLGVDWTVRLTNALAFGCIVLLASALLNRHVADKRLAAGATAFTAVSVALLGVARMAWTETLFIVVVLVFLHSLERSLDSPHHWGWLAACVAATWGGFLLRYSGICLAAVGGVTLLVGVWRSQPRVALRNALAFGTLAVSGPALVMLHNRSTDGTLMGPRFPSSDTPIEVAERVVRTLGEWAIPLPLPEPARAIIGVTLIAGVVATFVATSGQERRGHDDHATSPLLPTVTFIVGYAVCLVLAQLTTAIDGINSRLMSPLFVPVVLVVAVALDRFGPTLPSRRRRIGAPALIAILCLQGAVFSIAAVESGRNGEGYARALVQTSELAAAVGDLPQSVTVYSNEHYALWAATGRQPVSPSARVRSVRGTNEVVAVPESFRIDAECGNAYLAWFDALPRYDLSPPEDLVRVVDLVPVSRHRDGTLYRLGPRNEPDCTPGA